MVLAIADRAGRALDVRCGDTLLATYVYAPDDPAVESPRPYFHPVRTLAGDEISLYRPHDHVWHKGIAWSLPNVSLPNVGTENFWGGPTYTRGRGYEQLPNNGTIAHRAFEWMTVTADRTEIGERLDWITAGGDVWFDETRSFAVALVDATAWVLTFATRMTNVSAYPIMIGSPTTEGRDNAGYGGLFWRGPRSFSGGTVYAPGLAGGDELMGIRADWLGFAGRHEQAGSLDASRPRPGQFADRATLRRAEGERIPSARRRFPQRESDVDFEMAARPASSLATGTRNGEHET